jgi:hypothetical protein
MLHHTSTRHQAVGGGSKADKRRKTERAPKQTKISKERERKKSKNKKQEGGKAR